MAIPEHPNNRKERYLAKIAGQAGATIPAHPHTREEMYLEAIAEGGGGGGPLVVHFTVANDKSVSCDKTKAEILEAMETNVVLGVLSAPKYGISMSIGVASMSNGDFPATPCWFSYYNDVDLNYRVVPVVGWNAIDNEWKQFVLT